jgi:4a-hydroxytetrahydrobiopterin dehydratase
MAEVIGQISPADFHQSAGVEDWRVVGDGVCAYFRTGSFADGARLVRAIAEMDGLDEHHPDVDVRWAGVTVRLITITGGYGGYYGITERDAELARRISATVRDLGFPADPSVLQNVQVSIDALVTPDVLPFWRAVLGYAHRGDTPYDLIDPQFRGPLVYFQQMDAPRPQRNRLHFDVWVAHDRAEARVEAALAAGGHLVTDSYAPSWWVLADAEGNEACVATWVGRE